MAGCRAGPALPEGGSAAGTLPAVWQEKKSQLRLRGPCPPGHSGFWSPGSAPSQSNYSYRVSFGKIII